MARKPKAPLRVETLTHDAAARTNIPTAELQSVMTADDLDPRKVRYQRNHDLDPQLVWRGKDVQHWSDLVVNAPPLFIQEKLHPKVLIDDLMRRSKARQDAVARDGTGGDAMPDLFADFNGIAPEAVAEFYRHDQNWQNRMILGDSLQVMASLAEREGLRGQVQCIYLDPPYGIRFNSNFQWSTTTRDVKDGKADHITREPEQVRAFRDTWRDGIHSYLSYLRDRLTVARDLLTDSGSIFVQIGDENVHRVRALMDEAFGEENFIAKIIFRTTGNQKGGTLEPICDFILFYSKNNQSVKYKHLFHEKSGDAEESANPLISGGTFATQIFDFEVHGRKFSPAKNNSWKTAFVGMQRLLMADRILPKQNSIRYRAKISDFGYTPQTNIWLDMMGQRDKVYVVQTNERITQRCILMTTDPGDLVLDPTCGSGTTATVAEQWGRRWITIDTSRVALALARARIMGARYPYYLLADSPEGRKKEQEVSGKIQPDTPTQGDIRHGFVCERVPHITLKSIANNAEIDVIWDNYQQKLEPLRQRLNAAAGKSWEEWEIPRETGDGWPDAAKQIHADWWARRIARQQEIDTSIARKADVELLYDRPYEDKSRVRVAGPFTVESLSPHRVVAADADDDLINPARTEPPASADTAGFAAMVIENLKAAGVHQQKKADRIVFSAVTGWPGEMIAAEGRYQEARSGDAATGTKTKEARSGDAATGTKTKEARSGDAATGTKTKEARSGDAATATDAGEAGAGTERRAAIFIGPEFGTVARADLVRAAREAADAGFDILVACAFNYDAHSAEIEKLGRIPILKARMNPDLHMAGDLKASAGGNLFVVFGEPDIDILTEADGRIRVKIHGVDIFRPGTGAIDSGGTDDIAMWFVDTTYNDESFFVRHAYFLGAGDPYKSLKTTLRAEIDEAAWSSLYSDISQPFDKPATGRIAVKVINHLGDEVMKVFSLG